MICLPILRLIEPHFCLVSPDTELPIHMDSSPEQPTFTAIPAPPDNLLMSGYKRGTKGTSKGGGPVTGYKRQRLSEGSDPEAWPRVFFAMAKSGADFTLRGVFLILKAAFLTCAPQARYLVTQIEALPSLERISKGSSREDRVL